MIKASTKEDLLDALKAAKDIQRTTVIVVETDREQRVGGYESWWDVSVAEISTNEDIQKVREDYEEKTKKERYFLK